MSLGSPVNPAGYRGDNEEHGIVEANVYTRLFLPPTLSLCSPSIKSVGESRLRMPRRFCLIYWGDSSFLSPPPPFMEFFLSLSLFPLPSPLFALRSVTVTVLFDRRRDAPGYIWIFSCTFQHDSKIIEVNFNFYSFIRRFHCSCDESIELVPIELFPAKCSIISCVFWRSIWNWIIFLLEKNYFRNDRTNFSFIRHFSRA